MRGIIVAITLVCLSLPASAQSQDSSDRALGIEMNRDKAEGRIERLRQDKNSSDKARAEDKKPATTQKNRTDSDKHK